MTHEQQLKLQAHLDRQLSEAEAREVTKWLAADPQAAALYAELKNTRAALVGGEAGIKLPETREFYWSRIAREIGRLERLEPSRGPALAEADTWFARLRRFVVPAGAMAGLAIAALLALNQPLDEALFETSVQPGAGTQASTDHDYAHGATLVWLSFPSQTGAGSGQSESSN